ncbi:MAG: hypothetical protein CL947_04005 [Epsilonproteobacteria bacterium]|nr:hypothetical protein [Campylobacterota bacterium]
MKKYAVLWICLFMTNSMLLNAFPESKVKRETALERLERLAQQEDSQQEDVEQGPQDDDELLGLKYDRFCKLLSQWRNYVYINQSSDSEEEIELAWIKTQEARKEFNKTPMPTIFNVGLAGAGAFAMRKGLKNPGVITRAFALPVMAYATCHGIVNQVLGDSLAQQNRSIRYIERDIAKTALDIVKQDRKLQEKELQAKDKEVEKIQEDYENQDADREKQFTEKQEALKKEYNEYKKANDLKYKEAFDTALQELEEYNKKEAAKRRKKIEAEQERIRQQEEAKANPKKGWF